MNSKLKMSLNDVVISTRIRRDGGDTMAEPEVEVEDMADGQAVWIRILLRGSAAHETHLDPFVVDLGPDIWLQGWSDGEVLTIASSQAATTMAFGFIQDFLAPRTGSGDESSQ